MSPYDARVATTAKKSEIDPLDFIAIDALLSDEERMIRDTVRRFVSARSPRAAELFEGRSRPTSSPRSPMGLLGRSSPATAARDELGRVRPRAARSSSTATAGLRASSACRARSRCGRSGSTARRSRSSAGCPKMATAELDRLLRADRARQRLGPRLDEDAAKRDGDDYVLNGTKMWITNGSPIARPRRRLGEGRRRRRRVDPRLRRRARDEGLRDADGRTAR